jgi:hypothetical protein
MKQGEDEMLIYMIIGALIAVCTIISSIATLISDRYKTTIKWFIALFLWALGFFLFMEYSGLLD